MGWDRYSMANRLAAIFRILKRNSDTPSKYEASGKTKSCKVALEPINIYCYLTAFKVYGVWR